MVTHSLFLESRHLLAALDYVEKNLGRESGVTVLDYRAVEPEDPEKDCELHFSTDRPLNSHEEYWLDNRSGFAISNLVLNQEEEEDDTH